MQLSWFSQEDYKELPAPRPIYFDLRYLQLFASVSRAEVKILKLAGSDGVAYMPLELRPLSNGKWEASGSYGYGGLWSEYLFPISTEDWNSMIDFLATQHIVCALIRHAPFLHNHLCWPSDQHTPNRHTYARGLDCGSTLEQFAAGADQKLRWSIHAARRQQLQVEFYPASQWQREDLAEFGALYRQLMQDKGTNSFYRFADDFLEGHGRTFGDQCELALIRAPQSRQIVAASLFLLDEAGWAHYHLSASARDSSVTQTVELLLAEAIVRYGNAGYQWLHLGGGHRLDESDGLSRFKKKFSDVTFDFDISTWICDAAAYRHERELMPLKHPSCFLIHDARGAL